MTNAGRAAHPCIGPGRADLVVAGCAILEAILRTWPAPVLGSPIVVCARASCRA